MKKKIASERWSALIYFIAFSVTVSLIAEFLLFPSMTGPTSVRLMKSLTVGVTIGLGLYLLDARKRQHK